MASRSAVKNRLFAYFSLKLCGTTDSIDNNEFCSKKEKSITEAFSNLFTILEIKR